MSNVIKTHLIPLCWHSILRPAVGLALSVLICLLIVPLAKAAEPLSTGKGSYIFRDDAGRPEKPVTVWYYKPANLSSTAKMLFVMHGMQRNGKEYRDHWASYAEKYNFLLVVPEFSEQYYPNKEEYQFGNITDSKVHRWSFSVVEHLFDALRASESLSAEKYYIYGHSAGAQFVHRYILFMQSPRVEVAISANAGSYTMPIYPSWYQSPFPWSLDKGIVSEDRLKCVFARRLIVMLGENDTDPNHKYLPKSSQAMAQGKTRFERGQNFYQTAQKQAAALMTPFNWELVIVPGVAHSDNGMGRFAAKYLFENQLNGLISKLNTN